MCVLARHVKVTANDWLRVGRERFPWSSSWTKSVGMGRLRDLVHYLRREHVSFAPKLGESSRFPRRVANAAARRLPRALPLDQRSERGAF